MKGAKPNPAGNVVPMKGDAKRPVIEPPDMMTDLGRQIWDELAPVMARMSRLEPHYRYQFMSYCEAVANFITATNEVALHGIWYEVKTRNGLQQKKTAAWNQQQESANAMRRDAALFGLTPVDESRLDTGGQGDLFDKLVAQLKGGQVASD